MSELAASNDALRVALRGVLLRAQELVALLADHLDVTGDALARGDAGNLEAYLSHELALLSKLDDTFHQQHGLLSRHGLTADRQGMETAIQRCADSELGALWLALRKQLADCRERNRSNARLAKQTSRRAQAALQILRGERVEAAGYGPQGEVQSTPGGHTIARV